MASSKTKSDPLAWTCPKCGADPFTFCRVVVDGGQLNHDYGTHPERKRLALFFEYNPEAELDNAAWDFATKRR